MMGRRRFLLASLAGALAAPVAAGGQPRMPTIGVLSPTTADNPIIKAFEQALAGQGYVADKTVRRSLSTRMRQPGLEFSE
jgi:hypothetical protein